jgi:DNA-binding transcriptional MerR regulator
MGWSTREVADLAGTTLRAVRYYHEVGLLEEPRRTSNGYKQYGVAHLDRLLRIRRLTELGIPLQQLLDSEDVLERPYDELRRVSAEMTETIERLRRVQDELAEVVARSAPVDLPPELAFAGAADPGSPAYRLLVVLGRVLAPEEVAALAAAIQDVPDDPAAAELEHLPDDADEATRQDLAERMLPGCLEMHSRLGSQPISVGRAHRAVRSAVEELYSPAQRDVLRRLDDLRVAYEGEGARVVQPA